MLTISSKQLYTGKDLRAANNQVPREERNSSEQDLQKILEALIDDVKPSFLPEQFQKKPSPHKKSVRAGRNVVEGQKI